MSVGYSKKATSTLSKPQNQGRWTKQEEIETRTLPLDFEDVRIRDLFRCVWERIQGGKRERERERERERGREKFPRKLF